MYSGRLGCSLGFSKFGDLPSVANGVMPSSPPRRAVPMAYRRGVEHADEMRFVKSPRRRGGGDGRSLAPFFNKGLGFLLLWASLLLLAGRGGEEEKKGSVWRGIPSSYPGGDVSTPPEWKSLPLIGAPWWSCLSASRSFRCYVNKLRFEVSFHLGGEMRCSGSSLFGRLWRRGRRAIWSFFFHLRGGGFGCSDECIMRRPSLPMRSLAGRAALLPPPLRRLSEPCAGARQFFVAKWFVPGDFGLAGGSGSSSKRETEHPPRRSRCGQHLEVAVD